MFQMALLLLKDNNCAKLFCNLCINVEVMAWTNPDGCTHAHTCTHIHWSDTNSYVSLTAGRLDKSICFLSFKCKPYFGQLCPPGQQTESHKSCLPLKREFCRGQCPACQHKVTKQSLSENSQKFYDADQANNAIRKYLCVISGTCRQDKTSRKHDSVNIPVFYH